MKINQVEQLVGITKGNIRFYEKEGLLTPGRNHENGYRDYSDADVAWLKKIKLLRMLDVPIEEILRLKSGELTLEDAMGRHMIQLERRRANLDAMAGLCTQLWENRSRLDTLDVDAVLAGMEQQEQEGTKFMNVKRNDRVRRYIGPVVGAAIIVVPMAWFIGLMVWAFSISPDAAPPIGVLALFIGIPMVIIVSVLVVLIQRFREIDKGELDEASKY